MTRMRGFRGKTLFGGLITAPLVMPEVITGVSILMMFVAVGDMLGAPIQRGLSTVWIAHVTFTVAFVTVVISSRLQDLDRSLEEAAMDNIPAIVIDPKGDISNLLLTFPDLTPENFRPWINEDDATKKGITPDEHAAKTAAMWKKLMVPVNR